MESLDSCTELYYNSTMEIPTSPHGIKCDIRGHDHNLQLMWTAKHPEGHLHSRLRCPEKDYRWFLIHGRVFSRIASTRWGTQKKYDDFPENLERVE